MLQSPWQSWKNSKKRYATNKLIQENRREQKQSKKRLKEERKMGHRTYGRKKYYAILKLKYVNSYFKYKWTKQPY